MGVVPAFWALWSGFSSRVANALLDIEEANVFVDLAAPCSCNVLTDCQKKTDFTSHPFKTYTDYSTCKCKGGCNSTHYCKYERANGYNSYVTDVNHWKGYCQKTQPPRPKPPHTSCDSHQECALGLCHRNVCKLCFEPPVNSNEALCRSSPSCHWSRGRFGRNSSGICDMSCFLLEKSVCDALGRTAGAQYCEWMGLEQRCAPRCDSLSHKPHQPGGSCLDQSLGKCHAAGWQTGSSCEKSPSLLALDQTCTMNEDCASGICLDDGFDVKSKAKTLSRKSGEAMLLAAKTALAITFYAVPVFIPPMLAFRLFPEKRVNQKCRYFDAKPLEAKLQTSAGIVCPFYSVSGTDLFCAEKNEQEDSCTTSVDDMAGRVLKTMKYMEEAWAKIKTDESHLELESGGVMKDLKESLIGKAETKWTWVTPREKLFPDAYSSWYMQRINDDGHVIAEDSDSSMQDMTTVHHPGVISNKASLSDSTETYYRLQCFDWSAYSQVTGRAAVQIRESVKYMYKEPKNPRYTWCKIPCPASAPTTSSDVEFLPNKDKFGAYSFSRLGDHSQWCRATISDCSRGTNKTEGDLEFWLCVKRNALPITAGSDDSPTYFLASKCPMVSNLISRNP